MAKILGLYGCLGWQPEYAWLHSAGASLWIDGTHKTSISEERLSREKYDGNYPDRSISYVLEANNLTREEVDIVCYAKNIHANNYEDATLSILKNEFPNSDIKSCDHHEAHSKAAFYTSPFEESFIITLDGAGNSFPTGYETGALAIGNKSNKNINVLYHAINGNNEDKVFNLAQIYNNVSRLVYQKMNPRYVPDNDYLFMESAPGKIMGLAGYGDYKNLVDNIDPLFVVDNNDFYFPVIRDNNYEIYQDQLAKYRPEDIAAWLQHQFEKVLCDYFTLLREQYPNIDKLCIGGGCGLNVLLNSKLIEEKIFSNVHIFPASNDSGLCYGAAVSEVIKNEKKFDYNGCLGMLGKEYTEEEIYEAIKNV